MHATKPARKLMCALLLSCAAPLLSAAEQDNSAGDSQAQSNNTQPGDKDPQATADKKRKTESPRGSDQEIFRPSEEISEDFAVSFPVDI